MKKKLIQLLVPALFMTSITFSQPYIKAESYDITKDKVLYTIGYAHLDTEWNWIYPTTIDEYIKNTMVDNFKLFEQYPDYVFNFTGSRRYKFMKEYYPDLYKKVKEYVIAGNWKISGSSVDEGEVNISSSESVIRQILYGNNFFRKEFNTESKDYMLPDCFGFVASLPSVFNHAGLLGFSTQKLSWGSANGIPFNVGVWNGPDGKGIIAAFNAGAYTSQVSERLDRDSTWNARIEKNIKDYGISFDYRYYGTGDVGGAPSETSVKNAVNSINNEDSKFKVLLTSSDQMYKDIDEKTRKKLPVYSGDLLLTEHSSGSLTSQSYMKRANRKNELLAGSAEQMAVMADWLIKGNYPFEKINNAWELVLGSQMHDILPGTSVPEAYEYAWNDEFIAMNQFSGVLEHSLSIASQILNTETEGRSVVVYNPVATPREDVVTVELEYSALPANVKVVDKDGKSVPSQIISRDRNKLTLIFLAKVPSVGLTVFDIQETTVVPNSASPLKIEGNTMENEYYKVKLNYLGEIESIYDKKNSKELLAKPAKLEFLSENPSSWPSWNMDWKDRKNPPIDYLDKEASVRITENGPVRVSFEVTKNGRDSEIKQIISLAAGEAGKRIEVSNKINWQSKGVSLKASFPLAVQNEFATYSLGTGTIQRNTNHEKEYEVPSKEWFDLTDNSGNYGVTILEDCKYGSDKPDNNTLRLTLMYTPRANTMVYQGTQDWGIHDFKYGIYAHQGNWTEGESPWQGKFLNQPLIAFEAPKHTGWAGKETSLITLSSAQVGLMAFKKMEEGDYYLVRINELYGKDAKNIKMTFLSSIEDAYEVNGQEQRIGDLKVNRDGTINIDMTKYSIRSFAVKFKEPSNNVSKPDQFIVELPFNQDGISFDNNRSDGNLDSNLTIPAELLPEIVVCEDIQFKIGNTADGQNNVVSSNGQQINLPQGKYNKLYILANASEDLSGSFVVDGVSYPLSIQKWTGFIGQHYVRELFFDDYKVDHINNAFVKRDNIAWYASHRHTPEKNDSYQYSYLYMYEINIPEGSKTLTLPQDGRIKIFAVTLGVEKNADIQILQTLYDDFKDNPSITLSIPQYVTKSMTSYDTEVVSIVSDSTLINSRGRFPGGGGMPGGGMPGGGMPGGGMPGGGMPGGGMPGGGMPGGGMPGGGMPGGGMPGGGMPGGGMPGGGMPGGGMPGGGMPGGGMPGGNAGFGRSSSEEVVPPSINDYADINSRNNVSISYYPTGTSDSKTVYKNQSIELTSIFDSSSDAAGQEIKTIWFDNGEGRYLIDLQDTISIEKINFYFGEHSDRGKQMFSLWAADSKYDFSGSPVDQGWEYINLISSSSSSDGISVSFNDKLMCRYLLIISDGDWHGSDYFEHIDIFRDQKTTAK